MGDTDTVAEPEKLGEAVGEWLTDEEAVEESVAQEVEVWEGVAVGRRGVMVEVVVRDGVVLGVRVLTDREGVLDADTVVVAQRVFVALAEGQAVPVLHLVVVALVEGEVVPVVHLVTVALLEGEEENEGVALFVGLAVVEAVGDGETVGVDDIDMVAVLVLELDKERVVVDDSLLLTVTRLEREMVEEEVSHALSDVEWDVEADGQMVAVGIKVRVLMRETEGYTEPLREVEGDGVIEEDREGELDKELLTQRLTERKAVLVTVELTLGERVLDEQPEEVTDVVEDTEIERVRVRVTVTDRVRVAHPVAVLLAAPPAPLIK